MTVKKQGLIMRNIINYDHSVTASKTVNLSNPAHSPVFRIFIFS